MEGEPYLRLTMPESLDRGRGQGGVGSGSKKEPLGKNVGLGQRLFSANRSEGLGQMDCRFDLELYHMIFGGYLTDFLSQSFLGVAELGEVKAGSLGDGLAIYPDVSIESWTSQ